MGAAKLRLAVATAAFLAWLGWLGYLVFQSRDPVILSRPQFLVANLHVIASLTGAEKPDAKVKVLEVIWTADQADAKLVGSEVAVQKLEAVVRAEGWEGPGDYIVPLTKSKTAFALALIPPSPGYPGDVRRIYRATPEAREQLAQMPRSR